MIYQCSTCIEKLILNIFILLFCVYAISKVISLFDVVFSIWELSIRISYLDKYVRILNSKN